MKGAEVMEPVRLLLKNLEDSIIQIGYVGENNHVQIQIDCAEVFEKYPEAIVSMAVSNPLGQTYPAIVENEGDDVLWTVTSSDVSCEGDGKIQLTFINGEEIIKTATGKTRIKNSIVGNGPAPDPIVDFVTRADTVLAGIPDAIDSALEEAKESGEFKGDPGEDGYTPVKGVDYFDGQDGQDGQDGADGISPSVTVTDITGGHRVMITDAEGPHSFDVMDGQGGGTITVDDELSNLSTNPVQNKVITEEVTSLKEAIAPLTEITDRKHIKGEDMPIHTSNGYINGDTGEFVSTNAGRCTIFLPLNGTKSNYVEGWAFMYNALGVAFYDVDKAYISGISGNTGTSKSGPQKFALTAPSNARYVRWSLATESSNIPTDFNALIVSEYDDKEYTVKYAYTEVPVYSSNGYIDGTNGNFTSSNVGRCTDFFPIPSNIGGTVTGKAFINGTYGIAFYNACKRFISGYVDAQASGYTTDFTIPIPEDAKYMRWAQLYNGDSDLKKFAVSFVVPVQLNIKDLSNVVNVDDRMTLDVTTGEMTSTSSWATTGFINVASARRFSIQASLYTTHGVAFYDGKGNLVGSINGNTRGRTSQTKGVTIREDVPDGVCFIRATIYKENNYSVPADFCPLLIDVDEEAERVVDYADEKTGNGAHNVLILGDSYSNQRLWVDGMRSGLNISEVINLGVTSATIKDKQADRTQYPYTSRPTSSGTGNQNTLGSQIEKLKRLKTGSDLDSGEVQIYADHSPDIVIIEGGMNDSADDSTKESAYPEQFIVKVENVYYKNSAGTVTQGDYYIKPSDETTDRTSFAGAYRHIVEELLTLFPDAQIFITTASRFNYFRENPQGYDKIAEQQMKCARYCAASVIDWNGEGNISTITDCPTGSGTSEDPYTVYGGTLNTADGLHPNARGGRTYGRLAANVIRQRFANIGKLG